jgi:SPP1 family phage portal protein
MHIDSRDMLDKELVENFTICGTSYRMVLPNKNPDADSSPFNSYVLDPANAFVVYHTGLGNKPVMGVKVVQYNLPEKRVIYSVYTEDEYFEVEDGAKVIKIEKNPLGRIPIVEYPANTSRLGAFEIVIPVLNAINLTQSDRLNGIQQFIQAIMVIINAKIDNETLNELREKGAIRIISEREQPADIKYLVEQLDQMQTQVLIDDMYEAVLTICGMPNRNGGNSTSDTGAAVIMRDGWSAAEARAKDTESIFKKSEKQFLKIVLKILRATVGTGLTLSDIDIQFTRRNYDNIQSKTQVLIQLLNNPKIHPLLAFTHCGLFADPERAYRQSKEYWEEEAKAQLEEEKTGKGKEGDYVKTDDVRNGEQKVA